MSDDRWSELSARMVGGDADAADEIVRAYEPYLRMVVRRQLSARLRTRVDSHDVVQSVWAETIAKVRSGRASWRFRDETRLRSFLTRLARNRLIDVYRRHRGSLAREQPLSPRDVGRLPAREGDRPSEVVAADELWSRLLEACPPAHRELLRLRSQGAPIAEVAARTGFHEGSVRRILYELADRFAPEDHSPPPRLATS